MLAPRSAAAWACCGLADVGADRDRRGPAADGHERVAVAGLEDGGLGRRHDAIGAVARREGAEVVLGVDVDAAVRGDDERADVELLADPDGRADDECHRVIGRGLDERGQARVVLGEREVSGDVELVAGERKLGEDDGLGALIGREAREAEVLVEVGVDVTADGDGLGCGESHANPLHRRGLVRAFCLAR